MSCSFDVDEQKGRDVWRALLKTIESKIVLTDGGQGMLADVLNDYLWARSDGRIGSLMTLINRGCSLAIRNGDEVLTQELLDSIPVDVAAEETRLGNAAAIRSGQKKARTR